MVFSFGYAWDKLVIGEDTRERVSDEAAIRKATISAVGKPSKASAAISPLRDYCDITQCLPAGPSRDDGGIYWS
jgi:hypothetical protein